MSAGTRPTRMARGTTPTSAPTRSRLILALREAEQRGDRRLVRDLRRLLGSMVEVNETVRVRDGLDRKG